MSLYIVKAKKTSLKANLSTSGVQLTLSALVDSRGNAVAMASFGAWGGLVVKQGTTVEVIKFDGITQNADGSATIDIATNGRDVLPIYPFTGSSTGNSFLAGAEVIVTNDPLTMMNFANLANANTWDALQTFAVVPKTTGGNAVTANELVRKAQFDAGILGITTTVSIVVEGTAGETLTAGQLIYLKSADNRWWKADADDATTVNNVILGIAQGAGTAGNSITSGIMLRGVDSNQTGLTAGVKYYASNTAGGISTSAGTVEVTVGMSKSTTELYFDPRFDQMITEDQQDALVGNGGTPSASNLFVTEQGFSSAVVSSFGYFGNGADGSAVLDGINTFAWASLAGSTYTMTANVMLTNLTINSGIILEPAGYTIHGTGTLTNNGTIRNNGGNGGDGGSGGNGSSGGTGGSAGSATPGATLKAGSAGKAGGHGADWNGSNITSGGNGDNATTLGSNGVAGGTGGGTSNAGTAGTNTAETLQVLSGLLFPVNISAGTTTLYNKVYGYTSTNGALLSASAGSGGGGGGVSGTNSSAGGGGGGSGATGGVIAIYFRTITNGATGIIQANGGNGGNGGNSSNAGTACGGGGGAGGNGGTILLVYMTLNDTGTIQCAGGTKGTGGLKTGSGGTNGSDGTDGSAGKIFKAVIV